MISEGFADRLTARQQSEANDYIDKWYPHESWSATVRSQIYLAFIDGGSATLDSIIEELQKGK